MEPKAAIELHEPETAPTATKVDPTTATAAPVSLDCSAELEADIKTPLLKLKAQQETSAAESATEACLGNGTLGESQSLLE